MSLFIKRILFNKLNSNLRLLSSYSAACLKEYGKPLEINQITRPPLKPDEVRIGVKYCSLNYNDVKYIERVGEKTLPYIPGYELSGEVVEAGSECDCDEGDRVVGLIHSGNGGLAKEAILKEQNVWKLHPEIPYDHAAAIVSAHSTALLAFTQFYKLQEGNTVLVIAGAGGYGLAAVDVASSIFKAKVIGLSDTNSTANLLRDRGAFAAFQNNLKSNFKEIMKVTNNKGVDLIYDGVGGPIINTVVKCLKDADDSSILGTYNLRNKILQSNKTDGDEKTEKGKKKGDSLKEEDKPLEPIQLVCDKFKNVNIFKYQKNNQDEFYNLIQQTLDYYEDEVLIAHISKKFQLEDINQAIEYIKGKKCTGKVLIEMKDDD